MKKCPFCKNEIEVSSEQCPICKRTLIEKVPFIQPIAKTPNSKTSAKDDYKKYKYTEPQKTYTPQEHFKLPRGSGWIISIVGSILLSVILSNIHTSSNPLPAPIPETTTQSNLLPTVTPPTLQTIPTTPDVPYYSLPSGTVLYKDPSLDGSGVLTVTNGTSIDATVKLITSGVSGQKVYWVYIRANNSYSIKNINDGNYRVLFSSGSNWDVGQRKFLVNPSAEFFDDNFDFETSDTQSTRYTLTLNPVVGGTATTSTIDPSEFDKY